MQIFDKKSRGFSLVELLVVAAIIGILIAILVIGLSTVKNKAKDAAIQSVLWELRSAAELYYHNTSPSTYEGVCDLTDTTLSDDGDFGRIETNIIDNGGTDIGCRCSETAYAVISSLNLGDCWCVDSLGASRKVDLEADSCSEELETTACP